MTTPDPADLFRWAPDHHMRIERVGTEESPVIIIDNVFSDMDALRAVARDQQYTAIGEFYPGIRAPLPPAYSLTLLETLSDVMADLYGPDAAGLIGESFFSLVTTPPHRLKPIQRLPHYDGCGNDQFAAIAYLSGDDLGGTSFFRHRRTGFETVTTDRFPAYKAALEQDVAEQGLPEPAYLTDGGAFFDRIETVEAKVNRLVLYRGVQLHSGSIHRPDALSADPARGRLTITSFFKKRR